MIVPDGVHAAIRRWMQDKTNRETWRGPEFVGENLAFYLREAGFRIVPAETKRQIRLSAARAEATHSEAEWHALLQWAGNTCLCCQRPFETGHPAQKDHVVPLACGGGDSIENIQPLCGPCNRTKSINTVDYRTVGWRESVFGEVCP